MLSLVWDGDESVNQAWGPTPLQVEPLLAGSTIHWHCGIDVGSPDCAGKAFYAARAGVVVARSPGILGIRVPTGETDYYVHGVYGSTYVAGAAIAQREQIGLFSNVAPSGGYTTGPHLHFEVQPPGGALNVPKALDPVPILEAATLAYGAASGTGGLDVATLDDIYEAVYVLPPRPPKLVGKTIDFMAQEIAGKSWPQLGALYDAAGVTYLLALEAKAKAVKPVDLAPVLAAVADVKAAVAGLKVAGGGLTPEQDAHLAAIEVAVGQIGSQLAAGLKVDLAGTAKA